MHALNTSTFMGAARYRLGIVTTHPIQYHSPFFRALASAQDVALQVFYCYTPTGQQQADAGFGVRFDWDVPLLEGYSYTFLSKELTIRDVITKNRFDAVMVNGWSYAEAIQTILRCWATRTPVMIRSDSHLHTPRNPIKSVIKYLPYRAFITKVDACLAVGRWSRDYYAHYGAEPERVFEVPHVIDLDRFDSEIKRFIPERKALRTYWELADDAVVFLFAGKFIDKKRPADFVRAISQAASRDPRIQALMVGDGELREKCEALAQSLRAPVKFAGFLNQSEITKAYTAADAMVLPSDGGETWGMVVNEAMFSGLPCLVSDKVGCGPDLIRHDTGAVFRLGDDKQLAALLCSFAQDPQRLRLMGQSARHLIEERYSPHKAVHLLLEAVSAVARPTPRLGEYAH